MIERFEHSGVPVVRMAHGKANALDIEFAAEITRVVEALEQEGAPGLVLTGQGTIFSAGVDLLRAIDGGAPYMRRFLPVVSRAFEAVFFYRGPLVTAVNGHAIAGGCILACAGDVRLLARGSGGIGVPEVAVGVPFPAIALETMRFVAAAHRFQDLIYGAQTFQNEAALERGLVDRVVEADALLDEAAAAVTRLNSMPRLTFETTKRQLRFPFRQRSEQLGAAYDAEVTEAWAHPVTLANVRAYVARTLRK